jgi:surfactin synthase thioesterase subunit
MTTAPDTEQARWLRDQSRQPGGVRLFCLPPAGAGASAFHGWSELLGPGVQVTAIQLPGREDRIQDRANDRLDSLLHELVPVLAGAVDGPYALFGHGLGALIAYEAARRLVERGAPPPLHLFVSALGAPHAPYRSDFVSGLPEPEFKRAMAALSGFPEDVAWDASLSPLLPTLRADFQLRESYQYADGATLACRLTVLVAADDNIPPLDLALWGELNTGLFRIRVIDGDQRFGVDQRRQVAEVVRAGLAAAL